MKKRTNMKNEYIITGYIIDGSDYIPRFFCKHEHYQWTQSYKQAVATCSFKSIDDAVAFCMNNREKVIYECHKSLVSVGTVRISHMEVTADKAVILE